MSSAWGSTTGPISRCPSPAVVLAAAAARTSRIRLTSAVSVLVVATTPCACSRTSRPWTCSRSGRAEIMAGRGSFIESFPLFGYALDDYDELFSEHLALLLRTAAGSTVVQLAGQAPRARSTAAASTRGPSRTRCPSGSRSAAPRSPSPAPAPSACRWRWRSSAASPPASRPSPSCTASVASEYGHQRPLLVASTPTASSPTTPAAADRHRLPGPQGRHGPDRPRTRLAADDPRPVRSRRHPARATT